MKRGKNPEIASKAYLSLFKAEELGGLESNICIASVQTAARHTEELVKRDFKLLTKEQERTGNIEQGIKKVRQHYQISMSIVQWRTIIDVK